MTILKFLTVLEKILGKPLLYVLLIIGGLCAVAYTYDAIYPETSECINNQVKQMLESGMTLEEIDNQIFQMLFK